MTEYDYATDIAVKQEEAYAIGITTGREQGAYENKLETARNLLNKGIDYSIIVDCTNLPLETVMELVQSH
jgi:hypothetical protein